MRGASPEGQAIARREEQRVLKFVESWEPSARTLVLFASEPAGIWEVLELDVLLPTYVTADSTTNTGMLARVIDEYPRFVVAVAQRDRAAVYATEQRKARSEVELKTELGGSPSLGKSDQGGWAQARFARHIEWHVEKHLRELADELEKLHKADPYRHLALGGTDEVVKELQGLLSQQLSPLVMGTFRVDFKHQTETEILDEARRVLHEFARDQEKELVSRLSDAAGANGQGVLGVNDTLTSVHDGRADTLVVADGVTTEGAACGSCDYVVAGRVDKCPRCGGSVEDVPDVVERAIEKAIKSNSHVDIVFGEAREWLLAQGGIGAVLRY